MRERLTRENQNFNDLCTMGDIQKEKPNNYLKWLRPSPLNTIFFSLKKKEEDVGGGGLGPSRREEGNAHGGRKINIW